MITEINGCPVRFTRRRYGSTTMTWLHVCVNGRWYEDGSPYPAVNWSRVELLRAVNAMLARYSEGRQQP